MRRILLLGVAFFLGSISTPSGKAQEDASVFPFVLPWNDATPSLTDLSGWLEAPAGKRGFIHAEKDGHLYAGRQRIRFFGVNFCFGANFPRHDDAEKIAARLAKFGINVVRFHHMDMQPFPGGIRARDDKSTRQLDPEALDRLDYFIAALKRHGIYANLNLLVLRPFNAADGLPVEIEKLELKERASVGFFYAPLLELQKEYARKLLTHRNVVTGLAYTEDPAVAFIEINNENGLAHSWLGGQLDGLPEVFARDLRRQWNEWLRDRYRSTEKLRAVWGAKSELPNSVAGLADAEHIEDGTLPMFTKAQWDKCTAEAQRDWMRFLSETEDHYWQSMDDFLKNELRVHAVVMGTIVGCSTPDLMARFDAVDTHAYWQHPQFPGKSWDDENWLVPNVTMVNERGGTLPTLALHRVLGKPHCVTEYNHPAPNTYGSEGFLLLAAYAALQDWDAIYAFAYSHRHDDWDTQHITSFFDIDQHPTKMATLVPAMAMFVRGDVRPAQEQVVVALDGERDADLLRRAHAWGLIDASLLGVPRETPLVHRVAIDVTGRVSSPGIRKDLLTSSRFVSDTGELVWDASEKGCGVITVNTAKSKAVIGFGGGKRFDLDGTVIEPGATRQNGWCAITVTELQSGCWLVTATGSAENTAMQWKNAEHSSVGRNWGKAPSLIEGISARITMPLSAKKAKGWALDERGEHKEPLSLEPDEGGHAVLVIGPEHKTLWYEVSEK